nr:hypothetical protein [candidate division Zixibacteria bacterium]
MFKVLRVLILVGLLPAALLAQDNHAGYAWGTSRDQIARTAELATIGTPLLEKSNERYLSDKFATNLSLYIAKNGQYPQVFEIGGLNFAIMYGFYRDSLVYVIMATDEIPYSEKREKELTDRLRSEIIPEGGLSNWQTIVGTADSSGNIFGEECFAGIGEHGETYNEFQVSIGSISHPTHLQYIIYQMDKRFFDRLTESGDYRMDKSLKTEIGAQRTFTRYYSESELKRLKAEQKGKK